MILIDTAGHMVSDKSLNELHAFALKLALPRRYFNGTSRGHPHYDLTSADKQKTAVEAGATLITAKELAKRMAR